MTTATDYRTASTTWIVANVRTYCELWDASSELDRADYAEELQSMDDELWERTFGPDAPTARFWMAEIRSRISPVI